MIITIPTIVILGIYVVYQHQRIKRWQARYFELLSGKKSKFNFNLKSETNED